MSQSKRAAGSVFHVIRQYMLDIRKRLLLFLLLTALLMGVAYFFIYFQSFDSAEAVMSLNYEEGMEGANPNGTRFDMNTLTAEDTLARVVSYAGLEGVVTPYELSQSVSVLPSGTVDISKGYHISTTYQIRYERSPGVTRISAADMLLLITRAYQDVFHEMYTDNNALLRYDLGDLSAVEYSQIGDQFTLLTERMLDYLNMRSKQNANFTSESVGESVQSLIQLLQKLLDYDIAHYKAYVEENGFVRDMDSYKSALEYTNYQRELKYRKYMAAYNVLDGQVKEYDKVMSAAVMIPTLDRAREYYMSRAKIGIDDLTVQADRNLASAMDISESIGKTSAMMTKLNADIDPSQDVYLQQMTDSIENQLRAVSEKALTLERDFVRYNTSDYLSFRFSYQTFTSVCKTVLLAGAGYFILLCSIEVVSTFLRRSRQHRSK